MRAFYYCFAAGLVLFAPGAWAQKIDGNTFVHEGHAVKLSLPQEVRFAPLSRDDPSHRLVEFTSDAPILEGSLEVQDDRNEPLEAEAARIEEELKGSDGLKRVQRLREVKPKKTVGEWLAREFTIETDEKSRVRSYYVFARRGVKLYRLTVLADERDPAAAALVERIASGFEFIRP